MVRKENKVSMETKCCEAVGTDVRILVSVSPTRPKDKKKSSRLT